MIPAQRLADELMTYLLNMTDAAGWSEYTQIETETAFTRIITEHIEAALARLTEPE